MSKLAIYGVPMDDRPKSAMEAKSRGLKRYFTGKLCCSGHLSERDTRNSACVECQLEHVRKWKRRNAGYLTDYEKRRYEKHKDRIRKKSAEWFKLHPGYRVAWSEANPERKKASQKQYATAHPERMAHKWRTRSARKRGAGGTHTISDIDTILTLQKNKCAYCRRSLNKGRHVDHITPLARGGTNHRNNIQLLCPPCNLKKSDRDPIDFTRSRGLLL